MGVLTEYVRSEAEKLRAEKIDRELEEKEWQSAIAKLYGQMADWVAAADGGAGLLVARPSQQVIRQEARLGVYEVPCFTIALGSRRAEVVPRARHVIATIKPPGQQPRRADGMLEIRDGAAAEYYLFRRKADSGDEWYIRSVALWNADREHGTVELLDRDRFEAAILNVLK